MRWSRGNLNLDGIAVQKLRSNILVGLQLRTRPDLSSSFTNHGERVRIEVRLPGDKRLLRIRALGPQ